VDDVGDVGEGTHKLFEAIVVVVLTWLHFVTLVG